MGGRDRKEWEGRRKRGRKGGPMEEEGVLGREGWWWKRGREGGSMEVEEEEGRREGCL